MSAIGYYVNRECATKHAEISGFLQQDTCHPHTELLKIGLGGVLRIDNQIIHTRPGRVVICGKNSAGRGIGKRLWLALSITDVTTICRVYKGQAKVGFTAIYLEAV